MISYSWTLIIACSNFLLKALKEKSDTLNILMFSNNYKTSKKEKVKSHLMCHQSPVT